MRTCQNMPRSQFLVDVSFAGVRLIGLTDLASNQLSRKNNLRSIFYLHGKEKLIGRYGKLYKDKWLDTNLPKVLVKDTATVTEYKHCGYDGGIA